MPSSPVNARWWLAAAFLSGVGAGALIERYRPSGVDVRITRRGERARCDVRVSRLDGEWVIHSLDLYDDGHGMQTVGPVAPLREAKP